MRQWLDGEGDIDISRDDHFVTAAVGLGCHAIARRIHQYSARRTSVKASTSIVLSKRTIGIPENS